jgi:hypothetical protein
MSNVAFMLPTLIIAAKTVLDGYKANIRAREATSFKGSGEQGGPIDGSIVALMYA